MKILFLLSFLFCFQIYAQERTPFDFLQANAALKKAGAFHGVVSEPKADCQQLQSQEGDTVMSCAITDDDINNSVITKIDYDTGELPKEIQQALPEAFQKDAEKKKVSCVFRFTTINDNQQLLGCKRDNRLDSQKDCGDDAALTHQLSVGVSCATADGVSTAFTYSTELYTDVDKYGVRDDKGIAHVKQRFTSENIFALIQDNINEGKATYWKRGVGFINMSQKKKWGLAQSTGQQEWFHELLNSKSPGIADQYIYEEGSLDRWGAFVSLSIGLQENRKFGDKCKLSLSADVGGRLSTIKDSNTLNLNLNGKFSYEVTDNAAIYLRVQSDSVRRPGSTVTMNTLAAGFETKKGSGVEVGITQQNGNRRDVPDQPNKYSNKNDKLVFLNIKYAY